MHAIVFVVDSTEFFVPQQQDNDNDNNNIHHKHSSKNYNNVQMARNELRYLLQDDMLPKHLPLLVLCNKQDLPQAVSPDEIARQLGLPPPLDDDRPWQVLGCVATATAAQA